MILILDKLRVHLSKQNKARSAERKEQIERLYLLSYNLRFNTEERHNPDLKQEVSPLAPV